MTLFTLQVALLLLIVVLSIFYGGRPEKHVSFTYLAMLVLDLLHVAATSRLANNEGLELYRFALDLGVLGSVLFAALLYDRWWTLWVSSAQLLAVVAHSLRAAGFELNPGIYAIMERWPVWLALILTTCGIGFRIRRHRRN